MSLGAPFLTSPPANPVLWPDAFFQSMGGYSQAPRPHQGPAATVPLPAKASTIIPRKPRRASSSSDQKKMIPSSALLASKSGARRASKVDGAKDPRASDAAATTGAGEDVAGAPDVEGCASGEGGISGGAKDA